MLIAMVRFSSPENPHVKKMEYLIMKKAMESVLSDSQENLLGSHELIGQLLPKTRNQC